jgi:hypothetical protein
MIHRLIKPQIIKRFCHHGPTNFGKVMDNLNNIQIKTDLTAEKIVKLEKNIIDMEKAVVFSFFFNAVLIPWTIFLTKITVPFFK